MQSPFPSISTLQPQSAGCQSQSYVFLCGTSLFMSLLLETPGRTERGWDMHLLSTDRKHICCGTNREICEELLGNKSDQPCSVLLTSLLLSSSSSLGISLAQTQPVSPRTAPESNLNFRSDEPPLTTSLALLTTDIKYPVLQVKRFNKTFCRDGGKS